MIVPSVWIRSRCAQIAYIGGMDHRNGIRALRSTAQIPVRDVFGPEGASRRWLRKHVKSLEPRGRCAAAVAETALRHNGARRRAAALRHPSCPPYAMRVAGTDSAVSVREAARGVAGWSSAGRRDGPMTRTAAVAMDVSEWMALHATAVSECPPLVQTALCSPESPQWMRHNLAFSGVDTVHVVAALTADPSPEVRLKLVERSELVPCLAACLVEDLDTEVRRAVARYGPAPDPALTLLADDPEESVRVDFANRYAGVPAAALPKLAADPSPAVRAGVASAGCDTETLQRLATDTDPAVRAAVAALTPNQRLGRETSGCPPELLSKLSFDPDPRVRAKTAATKLATPQMLERLAGDDDTDVRVAVAAHEHCPLSVLERLVTDRRLEVRDRVATAAAAPLTALQTLASDRSEVVRRALAGRHDCPDEILEQLAADTSRSVRLTISERINALPSAVLETLYNDPDIEVASTARYRFGA